MTTCLCSPSLRRLQSELNDRWPDRDKSSDGCCASAAHSKQNPRSDHEPVDGYAHALDIDENLQPSTDPKPLLWLAPILLRDSRAKYVIYEKRIYYAACKAHGAGCFDAGGHAYDGINAHDKHLHLSVQPTATFETRSWLAVLDEKKPEEDDMPPAPAIVQVNGVPFRFVYADGGIWYREGSEAWKRIPGGSLTSAPGAVVYGNGTIEVVARGRDAATWSVERSPDGKWGSWVSIGGRS